MTRQIPKLKDCIQVAVPFSQQGPDRKKNITIVMKQDETNYDNQKLFIIGFQRRQTFFITFHQCAP